MQRFSRAVSVLAVSGMLIAGLAACTSDAAPVAEPTEAPKPIISIAELTGQETQVTVTQEFLDAIATLGLTPTTSGSATLVDGVFSFPISGGNVDYYDPAEEYRPYVQGSISHDGSGIALVSGDTVVDLTDFRVDPNESRLFATVAANGQVVADDVYVFRLDGSTLDPVEEPADGSVVLRGTTIYVSPDAAALLNETFGTAAVTEDLVVGTATITLAGE
jgi:hypothetical protein